MATKLSNYFAGPFSKPVTLIFDGDSKGAEPLQAITWARAYQPMAVNVGYGSGGGAPYDIHVGGSDTTNAATTGLTNATRLAATAAIVTAQAALNPVDIWLTIGTNDTNGGVVSSETVIANIRKYHNTLRAAGLRFLILMAIDPRETLGSGNRANVLATNAAYASYCALVPDAMFCDPSPQILDPLSTHWECIGGSLLTAVGNFGGLHASGYGIWMKYKAVLALARTIYRNVPYNDYDLSDIYDTTLNTRGNMLGVNGRFVSIGGNNVLFTNGGSGTVTGTVPLGCLLQGGMDGTMGITFAQAACPAYDMLRGTSGAQCVNLSFSGTPTSTNALQIQRQSGFAGALGTTPMKARALLNFNNVTGLYGIKMGLGGILPQAAMNLGSGTAPGLYTLADQMPTLNGIHEIAYDIVPTTNAGPTLSLYVNFKAGVPLTGSIDFIGASLRRDDPIPAATP